MSAVSLIRQTPLVRAPAGAAGPAVAYKLENLQRTGSFKLRGAAAALAALAPAARARGVVCASAGNHGAGLALAGRALGVAVRVVVPSGAPANKRARIAALGADVVVEGADYDQAEAAARRMAAGEGRPFVSPFDDDDVIAGNGGGLAAEILAQAPAARRVLCAVGGGGLIGGLAAALAPRGVQVVGVQPEQNCAMHESLRLGRALTDYRGGPTVAEGCAGAVAERTFRLAAAHVTEIALVSEAAIRRAVAHCYRALGQIVECSGAVPVAALLEGRVEPVPDGDTVVVLSGGNIDDALLDEILREHP